jgi:hypothetical protein
MIWESEASGQSGANTALSTPSVQQSSPSKAHLQCNQEMHTHRMPGGLAECKGGVGGQNLGGEQRGAGFLVGCHLLRCCRCLTSARPVRNGCCQHSQLLSHRVLRLADHCNLRVLWQSALHQRRGIELGWEMTQRRPCLRSKQTKLLRQRRCRPEEPLL